MGTITSMNIKTIVHKKNARTIFTEKKTTVKEMTYTKLP